MDQQTAVGVRAAEARRHFIRPGLDARRVADAQRLGMGGIVLHRQVLVAVAHAVGAGKRAVAAAIVPRRGGDDQVAGGIGGRERFRDGGSVLLLLAIAPCTYAGAAITGEAAMSSNAAPN